MAFDDYDRFVLLYTLFSHTVLVGKQTTVFDMLIMMSDYNLFG